MTPEQFLHLAVEYQLGHIAKQLLSTAVPAARVLNEALRPARPSDRTFLGGVPRPMPQDWPQFEEAPLTFVGQVDTSSLPPVACPVSLPAGVLQFFVTPTGESLGYEPSLDCGRVILVDSDAPRQKVPARSPPTPPQETTRQPSFLTSALRLFRPGPDAEAGASTLPHKPFPQLSFAWEVFPSLYASAPDPDALWLPEGAEVFELDEGAGEESFFEFREAVLDSKQGGPKVQMFGFPYQVQRMEDMQSMVNTAAGNRSSNEFQEWVLLFNLNSSGGGLAPEAVSYYYWIHRGDLAEGNLEEVWLCVQRD